MLKPGTFFDLQNVSFASLFEELDFPWEALLKIENYIQNQTPKNEGQVSRGALLFGTVIVKKGAIIDPYSVIYGPTFIGENTHIRPFSYIRGKTIIGKNCVIRGEVKDSIILNNTALAHFNYVGDSILGNNVNMGAGSRTANLRLDQENIKIKVNSKLIDTGIKKFGAIIGDKTQIGCNAVLNPGTLIGKNSIVYPLVTPKAGFYPTDSKIK